MSLGPSFHSQIWWQLGSWPINPYSCPVWISSYFFLPKAINITRNRCIYFLYFFSGMIVIWLLIYLYFRKMIKKYLNFKEKNQQPTSDSSSRELPFPQSPWRCCYYRWGLGQPVLSLHLTLHLPVCVKAHELTGSSIPTNGHLLFMVIRKCPCFQTYYVCSDVRLLF